MPAVSQQLELKLQRRIAAAIATNADSTAVLSRIAAAAARVCRSHVAAIMVLTASGKELEVVAVCGASDQVLGTRMPIEGSLSGLVIASGRTVRSTDAQRHLPVTGEFLRQVRARGVLAVALRDGAGPFGALLVGKRGPWRFADHQAASLRHLADAASIAIQSRRPPEARGEAPCGNTLRRGRRFPRRSEDAPCEPARTPDPGAAQGR